MFWFLLWLLTAICLAAALLFNHFLRIEVTHMNTRLKNVLSRHRIWVVDKQMIILETPEDANDIEVGVKRIDPGTGAELVVYRAHRPDIFPGEWPGMMDYSRPRMIRVTVTNGNQSYLIGDCVVEDGAALDQLGAAAQDQCNTLNAHEVK